MRMRVAVLLWAGCVWAQAPRPGLLLNAGDLARIERLSESQAWAASARSAIVNGARAWPAAYLTKYGLAEWSIPPEGGQWTHWYVCPTHGTGLQFRAPDKHVCPSDGRAWTDKKFDQVIYTWRNSDNAAAARDLGLAYRFTGDVTLAQNAARILLAYAEAYGSWPIHDTNGRIDARSGGRLSAQTLDESVWLIPIAWAYDLIADSGVLTDAEAAKIERDLLRAAASVIQRYDAGKSNWQSWHNAAIGAAGFAIGDDALVSQAIDGRSGFRAQMRESVYDDGFWYEGAWSYHFYALDPLWMLAEMASRRGIDLYSELPLRKMFEAPLRFALPDWTLPAFNDSGAVNVAGQSRYYEIAYGRYGDPLFALLPGRGTRGRDALLWGAESLPESEAPARGSELFLASGYAVLRAGAGDHTVILDFGPHGGGHGHYDKLGFVSYARGGVLGVDPGTQPYAAPTHNTWDKMTVAHNTVTVDEQTQREAEGEVLAFETSGPMTMVRAGAGGAYAQASLERTMFVAPEYAVDVFAARSLDDREHTFDWVYHNAGKAEAEFAGAPYAGFGKANGYQHLANVRGTETGDDWRVRFDSTGNVETNYGSTYVNAAGIKASFTHSMEQSVSGRFSGKLGYDFTQAKGYALYSTPALANLPKEMPERMSVMVYGDGSGNRLTLRLIDGADERFTRAAGVVDWTGWREVVLDVSPSWNHWGGDGAIDLPVRGAALELTHADGAGQKGALYADDIAFSFAEAGTVVAADFERTLRRLRVWMLGAAGTTALAGEGLGPDLRVPVPFAMARRKGREARFVTLLEPYGDEPQITSFRDLGDGRFEVTGPGWVDVFSLEGGYERRAASMVVTSTSPALP